MITKVQREETQVVDGCVHAIALGFSAHIKLEHERNLVIYHHMLSSEHLWKHLTAIFR